jgi:hypothetical protein
MQPQMNQPIFVKVERYDSQIKEIYPCVIQIKDILEVSQTHVLFNTGQMIRLTEESIKELQDFLLEFYSNAAYQARLAAQPAIQLS